MAVWHFQTSTMDAAKVLPECFPVLKIVRTWAAAIKPDPRAKEPHKGMDCMNVTASKFLVGKMPPQPSARKLKSLEEVPPSVPLNFSWSGHRSRGMSFPWIKSARHLQSPLRDRELGWEPGPYKLPLLRDYNITTHVLEIWGWRANLAEFPLRATLGDAPCLSFGCRVQVTGYKADGWQIQGVQKVWGDLVRWWCWSPHKGPGTLGAYPQWRFQVPLMS